MSFEPWLAFVGASTIMLVTPGPTVLLIISYILGHGSRAVLPTVAGVILGNFVAMTVSMLGLGALLASSATLFTVLKWIGAIWVLYLGLKLWLTPVAQGEIDPASVNAPRERPVRILLHSYLVTALNPKNVVFFVAFLPQFIDTSRPMLRQMVMLEATFLVLATLNAAMYATLASMARKSIRRPSVQRTVNRVAGSSMIAIGIAVAGWQRASA